MNGSEWLRAVRNVVSEIANPEFQERVWVRGKGSEVSSWTEAMCKLFDDYNLDTLLDRDWDKLGFSEELQKSLCLLRKRLNEYQEWDTDAEIVADPQWRRIRQLAKQTLVMLNKELSSFSEASRI